MIRSLKILGLALVVSFIFGAIAVAGAIAQNGKITSAEPVTLTGTQTGAEMANSLTAFGGSTYVCKEATYTGHRLTSTPHEFLQSGATAVTITPHYGLCKASGVFPTTVDMNGCDYELDLREETLHEGAEAYEITPTLSCPAGKHIVLTLFKTTEAHTAGTVFCEVEITEQPDYANTNLVARDTGNGSLDITGTVSGIVAHRRLTAGHSSIFCGAKTDEAAVLHLDLNVKAHNEAEEPTSISFSTPVTQGKITSAGPVTLTAEETGAVENNQFSIFGQSIRCSGSTYIGHAVRTMKDTEEGKTHGPLLSGSQAATVTPRYANCSLYAGLYLLTVDMNGCDYEFHIGDTKTADIYNIKTTIVCPTGKHITTTLFKTEADHTAGTSFCHITITENAAGYSGLVVRDTTNGHLDITGTITGITAHRKLQAGHSSIFCGEATTETGTWTLDLTVKGDNEAGETTGIALSE